MKMEVEKNKKKIQHRRSLLKLKRINIDIDQH